VLAAADLAAERTAARLRLGILVLIGLALAGLGSLAGVYSEWMATIFALNLGVSVAAIVLARPAFFWSWVPWVMATLDAGVLLGVMICGDFTERVSISYTPALTVSWAMSPLLALTAMIENGFVHLPKEAAWLAEYLHELTAFPRGRHDDQVDSTAQMLDWFKQVGREPQDWMWQMYKQHQAQQAGAPQTARPEPLSVIAKRLGLLRRL
jgi:hypothetical protein